MRSQCPEPGSEQLAGPGDSGAQGAGLEGPRHSLPQDSPDLLLLLRLLALGQGAWDMIDSQVFKEPKMVRGQAGPAPLSCRGWGVWVWVWRGCGRSGPGGAGQLPAAVPEPCALGLTP